MQVCRRNCIFNDTVVQNAERASDRQFRISESANLKRRKYHLRMKKAATHFLSGGF